jgi:hypothetical protein
MNLDQNLFIQSMQRIIKILFLLCYVLLCVAILFIDKDLLPKIETSYNAFDKANIVAFLVTLPVIYTILQTGKALQQNQAALVLTQASVKQNENTLQQNKNALEQNEQSINIAIMQFQESSKASKAQMKISVDQLLNSSKQFREQHEFDKAQREGEALLSLYNSIIKEIEKILNSDIDYNILSSCELPSLHNINRATGSIQYDLKGKGGFSALMWTLQYPVNMDVYSEVLDDLDYNESQKLNQISERIKKIITGDLRELITNDFKEYKIPRYANPSSENKYKAVILTDYLVNILDGENDELSEELHEIFHGTVKYLRYMDYDESKTLKLNSLLKKIPLTESLIYQDNTFVILSDSSYIYKYFELLTYSIELLKKIRSNKNFSDLTPILALTNIIHIENLYKFKFFRNMKYESKDIFLTENNDLSQIFNDTEKFMNEKRNQDILNITKFLEEDLEIETSKHIQQSLWDSNTTALLLGVGR